VASNCIPIPAFQDNYIWLIQTPNNEAAVVDPGDARPVLACLEERQLDLRAVLITHHHADHTGGLADLKQKFPDLVVYGPDGEGIAGINHPVSPGNSIDIMGTGFYIMNLCGHTKGHVGYLQQDTPSPAFFCGDALFSAGCGRLFEGCPGDLLATMKRIRALADDTLVYCAHEYTLANMAFACHVDPHNETLKKQQQKALHLRQKNLPTLPAILGTEKAINPFLRWDQPGILDRLAQHQGVPVPSGVEAMGTLRRWKDVF
jgi:hydroxyacylglutathione hydrolase